MSSHTNFKFSDWRTHLAITTITESQHSQFVRFTNRQTRHHHLKIIAIQVAIHFFCWCHVFIRLPITNLKKKDKNKMFTNRKCILTIGKMSNFFLLAICKYCQQQILFLFWQWHITLPFVKNFKHIHQYRKLLVYVWNIKNKS